MTREEEDIVIEAAKGIKKEVAASWDRHTPTAEEKKVLLEAAKILTRRGAESDNWGL